MNFSTLHRNFTELIEKLDKVVLDSAMEFKNSLADLNVKQLEKGLGYDGELIEPEYQSLQYANDKKAIGSRAPKGTPDLKVTGSTHAKTEAVRTKEAIVMMSTDEKYEKLNKKYPKAWGLNKKSKEELKPDLTEVLIKNARTILHKK